MARNCLQCLCSNSPSPPGRTPEGVKVYVSRRRDYAIVCDSLRDSDTCGHIRPSTFPHYVLLPLCPFFFFGRKIYDDFLNILHTYPIFTSLDLPSLF